MKSLSKIRLILIIASVIIGTLYAIPNFFNTSQKAQSSNFLPGKKINLGLDLKGGSYLLLKADMDVVFAEKLETLLSDIRSSLRKSKIGLTYATTAAAGSTTTGKSSVQLGISTAATTAKQLRVVRVAEDPENEDQTAANCSLVVKVNLHQYTVGSLATGI